MIKHCGFIIIIFILTFVGRNSSAQTCQSLFEEISVFSKFSSEDQRTLTLLAHRQVEVTADFSISKAQKDAALHYLKEQLEGFIGNSGLNSMEKQTLRREYRALVFQFKEQADFTIDTQLAVINHKNTLLEIARTELKQELIQKKDLERRKELATNLLKKYHYSNIHDLLFRLLPNTSPRMVEDIKQLISVLDNFDIRHKETNEPLLHSIISNRHTELAIILINKGADVNARDSGEMTALTYATVYHQIPVMKLLIEKGADVNALDSSGVSALLRSELKSAKILVEAGIDINGRDHEGNTLLHRHIYDLEFAEYLISNGLDVNARNNAGISLLKNAQTYFKYRDIDEVIELLKSKGAKE